MQSLSLRHDFLLPLLRSMRTRRTIGRGRWQRIGRTDQCRREPAGHFCPRGIQTMLCSKAKAVAAVRDETSSLEKMLLTWRATVLSLMNNSVAISLFDLPFATRARTSP